MISFSDLKSAVIIVQALTWFPASSTVPGVGLGRYGMVAPLGGDCTHRAGLKREKRRKVRNEESGSTSIKRRKCMVHIFLLSYFSLCFVNFIDFIGRTEGKLILNYPDVFIIIIINNCEQVKSDSCQFQIIAELLIFHVVTA